MAKDGLLIAGRPFCIFIGRSTPLTYSCDALPFSSSLKIRVMTTLTTLTTNPPKKAGQNPLMMRWMPITWPICPVSQNRKVLISKVKRPRVTMISGQVNNLSNGRRKAFTNPRIKASQITLTQPLSSDDARHEADSKKNGYGIDRPAQNESSHCIFSYRRKYEKRIKRLRRPASRSRCEMLRNLPTQRPAPFRPPDIRSSAFDNEPDRGRQPAVQTPDRQGPRPAWQLPKAHWGRGWSASK